MVFASILLLALVGGQTDVTNDVQAKRPPVKEVGAKSSSRGARGKLRPVTKEEFDRAAPEKMSGRIKSNATTIKERGL